MFDDVLKFVVCFFEEYIVVIVRCWRVDVFERFTMEDIVFEFECMFFVEKCFVIEFKKCVVEVVLLFML